MHACGTRLGSFALTISLFIFDPVGGGGGGGGGGSFVIPLSIVVCVVIHG